jgi:methyl-accepting chemotaxis protein
VIDEIAFQTNILALNAAVEAARAGEGWPRFADEVRNLAQRCAQAAKDTAALIEESIVKSHGGRGKVDEAAAPFEPSRRTQPQCETLVEEVSVASREEIRGIEQMASGTIGSAAWRSRRRKTRSGRLRRPGT